MFLSPDMPTTVVQHVHQNHPTLFSTFSTFNGSSKTLRCESYCPVASFCEQYKKLRGA